VRTFPVPRAPDTQRAPTSTGGCGPPPISSETEEALENVSCRRGGCRVVLRRSRCPTTICAAHRARYSARSQVSPIQDLGEFVRALTRTMGTPRAWATAPKRQTECVPARLAYGGAMTERLMRFGVAMGAPLLEEFDKVVERRGGTRSEALRDFHGHSHSHSHSPSRLRNRPRRSGSNADSLAQK
jgi:hypothetical protein